MQVNIDIITMIISIAIIQGLFIAVLMLTVKKKNKLSNILLALFLIACAISISGAVLYKTNIYRYWPHLVRINEPVRFLIAPLFYFYTLSLTSGRIKWHNSIFLHFIPFAVNALILLPFYIMSEAEKIKFVNDNIIIHQTKFFLNDGIIFWILINIQFIFYVFYVKKLLHLFKSRVEENCSTTDKNNLLWLNSFSNVLLVFCFCLLVITIIAITTVSFFKSFNLYILSPIPSIVSLFLVLLVLKALRQPEVFNDFNTEQIIEPKKKYEKSTLSQAEIEVYFEKLSRYMEMDKPYLEPELTLQQLADELRIPVRHLSQVINEKMGNNFYHYVNLYRVEAVKKQLVNPAFKEKPVLDLAFEAGFNSKATFNAVFKQFTGLTPRQFRQKHWT